MTALLQVDALEGGYGREPVLFGTTFDVGEGEAVALVGRNGMGKTTAIRAVMGLCRVTGGRVTFAGADITGARPYRVAQRGIGLVPEGRQVFPTLTVRENLSATAANHGRIAAPWTLRSVFDLFPCLAERAGHLGSQLSGGEQQMLAIGRALLLGPRLLILDEATEGLAPLVREEIWACLGRLRAGGQALLIVDKHLGKLAALTTRAFVLEKGRSVWSGPTDRLASDAGIQSRFLTA